jgi:hypothetical protein
MAQPAGNLKATLVRPQDLLVLDFEFVNLMLVADINVQSAPGIVPSPSFHLERINASAPTFIIVTFPGQHIAEKAFLEKAPEFVDTNAEEVPESPPVDARIAGLSRLVFQVPPGVFSIPYTTQGLLTACQSLPLNVAPQALPPATAQLRAALADSRSLAAATRRPSETARLHVQQTLQLVRTRAQQKAARMGTASDAFKAKMQEQMDGTQARLASQSSPSLQAPKPLETAIESPFRLILSPHQGAAWAHAVNPVTGDSSGRTELWHTRLGVPSDHGGVDERSPELRTVRAIWTRDPGFSGASPLPPHYDPASPGANPFRTTLDSADRHQIVHLSSDVALAPNPPPITVNRLMLSALGTWMDTRGAWEPPPNSGFSLKEWRQLGTLGRDHYVRVVKDGFLYPFGHRASLVTISERKFHPLTSGNVAYLRQRMILIVREPVRTYGVPGVPNGAAIDRRMPFKSVRITTLVTPILNDPASSTPFDGRVMKPVLPPPTPPPAPPSYGQAAFWPSVGNQAFQFHVQVTDLEGQTADLTAPMIFVDQGITGGPFSAGITDVHSSYMQQLKRRTSQMQGQKVAYAPSGTGGDTTFETQNIIFGAQLPSEADYNKLPPSIPRFFPVVDQAQLQIPAIKHLVGNNANPLVTFHNAYVQHAFDQTANRGEVFLQMADEAVKLDFNNQGDRSGGLVKPNMNISGLSRMAGPIGGPLDAIAKGSFDPVAFFQGLDAKVFGCINLWDIVQLVGDIAGDPDAIPKLLTKTFDAAEQFLEDIGAFLGFMPASKFLQFVEDLQTFVELLPQQFHANMQKFQKALQSMAKLGTAGTALLATIDDLLKDLSTFFALTPGIPVALADPVAFAKHVHSFANNLNALAADPNLDPSVKTALEPWLALFNGVLADVDLFVGIVSTIGSLGTALQTDIEHVITDFGNLPGSASGTPSALETHLSDFAGHIDALAKALPSGNINLGLRRELEKWIAQFNTVLTNVKMFVGLIDTMHTRSTALMTDMQNIIGDFGDLPDSALGAPSQLETHLRSLVNNLDNLLDALPGANLNAGVSKELDKRIAKFKAILADITQFVELAKSVAELPEQIKVQFEWRPKLKPFGFDAKAPIFIPKQERGLRIGVEVQAKTAGLPNLSTPAVDIICSLEKFDINLIAPASFLIMHFDKLQFLVANGKKPDVDVVIERLEFVGVLSFVETLKELIPLDGFSDPPSLDVTAEGIKAGYSLALPNVGLGLFSLQHLSLGALFTLPFIGPPLSVRFNFCERENPFLLTVSMFGGGGFFGISLTPAGVDLLEAAFEFGGALSLNLGVASGSVSVMAGVYFKMMQSDATLDGYFRIRGAVDVLGIIAIAIELRMDLSYEFSSGKCVGRATLIIEIEIIFFSKTVAVSCERKFAGSNGDPTFRQVMEPDPQDASFQPWEEYCQAFAA